MIALLGVIWLGPFIVLVLVPLAIEDHHYNKLIKYQHHNHYDAWVSEGKPTSTQWWPKGTGWLERLRTQRKNFLLCMKGQQEWLKKDEEAFHLQKKMRLWASLALSGLLICIVYQATLIVLFIGGFTTISLFSWLK
jgi:hypothetical protein